MLLVLRWASYNWRLQELDAKSSEDKEEKQNYRESLGSTAGADTPSLSLSVSVADMVGGCLPAEKCSASVTLEKTRRYMW